jgi:hypothetical protein
VNKQTTDEVLESFVVALTSSESAQEEVDMSVFGEALNDSVQALSACTSLN